MIFIGWFFVVLGVIYVLRSLWLMFSGPGVAADRDKPWWVKLLEKIAEALIGWLMKTEWGRFLLLGLFFIFLGGEVLDWWDIVPVI